LTSLTETFLANPYNAYVYAYPHKTAYRALRPPHRLARLWEPEKKDALFLYFHIPFCEQRCGYCNLFTTAQAGAAHQQAYLDQLHRQARTVRQALGPGANFARWAVGGGTPSLLDLPQLQRLFTISRNALGADPTTIPVSFEASPETLSPEKLDFLKDRGVNRLSIGVQSFIPEELAQIARHADLDRVRQALNWSVEKNFSVLNIDLIYGLPGQTATTWRETLHQTLTFDPEEVYLYPLYVRPLTGLARQAVDPGQTRLTLYRTGRDCLQDAGYQQLSMRHFRKKTSQTAQGARYVCQEDGMIGLGCGARSYTRRVHYSSEYAVGLQGVHQILDAYLNMHPKRFAQAHHGFILNHDEQARRYTLKSLLLKEGLTLKGYREYLGTEPLEDLPQLTQLLDEGLAVMNEKNLRLTETGLMLSDAIGPWLYSPTVTRRIEDYDLR
jgi:oxygen-independent coproporphyrinogen-3 oxidase